MTSETVQVNSGPSEISYSAKINTAAFSQPETRVRIWRWASGKRACVGCLPAEVQVLAVNPSTHILWRKVGNDLAASDVFGVE